MIGFQHLSILNFNIHKDSVFNNSVDQYNYWQLLPLKDKFHLTSTSKLKVHKMLIIHNNLKRALQASERVAVSGSLSRFDCSDVWNGFRTVLSYCADIPET